MFSFERKGNNNHKPYGYLTILWEHLHFIPLLCLLLSTRACIFFFSANSATLAERAVNKTLSLTRKAKLGPSRLAGRSLELINTPAAYLRSGSSIEHGPPSLFYLSCVTVSTILTHRKPKYACPVNARDGSTTCLEVAVSPMAGLEELPPRATRVSTFAMSSRPSFGL